MCSRRSDAYPTPSGVAEMPLERNDLLRILQTFCDEVSDLQGLSAVPELAASSTPTAEQFQADFVNRNLPCVLRGYATQWPAVSKWSLQHLASVMQDHPVTCTFTPDGKADACKIVGKRQAFVLPHTQQLTFREFRDILLRTRVSGAACVPSVQFQNGNMSEFASALAGDVPLDLSWAAAAFGTGDPDAVNVWVGDSRSFTSFHKVGLSGVLACSSTRVQCIAQPCAA